MNRQHVLDEVVRAWAEQTLQGNTTLPTGPWNWRRFLWFSWFTLGCVQ